MEWLFLMVSIVAVFAAGMMLTRQNAVHSALFLIVNFGCVALLYLMLDAPFLAMVQVTVYTGAIMVLFLFVIMLLGAETTTDSSGRMRWLGWAGSLVAIALLLIFAFPLASDMLGDNSSESHDARASLRLINAVPGGDAQVFRVLEMDFEVPLSDEVAATVNLVGLGEDAAAAAIEAVRYNDERPASRRYTDLPAGDYTLTATVGDSSYESGDVYSANVSLAAESAYTVLLYQNADGLLDYTLLEDRIHAPSVGKMRLGLVNGVAGRQVSLVDVGQYTTIRSLCEDAACSSLLPHRVLIDQLPLGSQISIELDEGEYNLAFVDQDSAVLRILAGYKAERGVVETRVLAREPGVPGSQPAYRAAVYHAFAAPAFGSPEAIGQVLFIDYVLPVMLVGVLLLVALIGVIVLARPDALAQAERRRINRRRRVSRPLASVIAQQTGADALSGDYMPKLKPGDEPAD
ncbi:MAG: NADH-quinone oxidoreductase subunit J [Chloroflexi bacterium]|nr:NADH-quinone oxidoreductase subunit J [Chloroflexota bacterium]MCY4247212.1 NADH-quinone oxidoreductase subunit J [Chloroflexota bacterium]